MLRRTLQRRHAAVRGALVARRALRTFAAGAALVAVAVLLGAAGGGPGAATARLVALLVAITAVLALGVRALLAELPRFDAWLESVERARPEVRSWLRNALDLESNVPAGTSSELAGALVREATERLERTELRSLEPGLQPARGRSPRWAPRRPRCSCSRSSRRRARCGRGVRCGSAPPRRP